MVFEFWKQFFVPRFQFWEIAAGAALSLLGGALGDDHGAEGLNDASTDAARRGIALNEKQYKYWEDTYQPGEKALIEEARTAGGLDDQEIAAGEANADVTQSFDRARRETEGRYAGFGLNSPNALAATDSLRLGEASTRGGAMTFARRGVRDQGFQKRFNVSQMGRSIPSSAISGIVAGANTLGRLGQNAGELAYLDHKNIAYGLAPLAKPIAGAARDWFSKPTTHANADAYGNMETAGGGGSDNWFRDGGRVKRKKHSRGYKRGGRVYAENGLEVPAPGGMVPGPEGAPPDSVDIKATPGEIVLNPEAVEVLGPDVAHAANKIGLMHRYDRENAGLEMK